MKKACMLILAACLMISPVSVSAHSHSGSHSHSYSSTSNKKCSSYKDKDHNKKCDSCGKKKASHHK